MSLTANTHKSCMQLDNTTHDYLTPWLMEPGGSMPHSQGLSNIPFLNSIKPIPRIDTYFLRYILTLPSQLRLVLPKGLFPVGVPVKMLKALLPSSIMICPSQCSTPHCPKYIT